MAGRFEFLGSGQNRIKIQTGPPPYLSTLFYPHCTVFAIPIFSRFRFPGAQSAVGQSTQVYLARAADRRTLPETFCHHCPFRKSNLSEIQYTKPSDRWLLEVLDHFGVATTLDCRLYPMTRTCQPLVEWSSSVYMIEMACQIMTTAPFSEQLAITAL